MYFSTKIDHPRIRHCDINRVKYNHKDLITNKKFSRANFNFATLCREVHFIKLLFSHSHCENKKNFSSYSFMNKKIFMLN